MTVTPVSRNLVKNFSRGLPVTVEKGGDPENDDEEKADGKPKENGRPGK